MYELDNILLGETHASNMGMIWFYASCVVSAALTCSALIGSGTRFSPLAGVDAILSKMYRVTIVCW